MNNQMNQATRRAKGLLNLREVATRLRVSDVSVTVYRNTGKLPPHVMEIGKAPRMQKLWLEKDIEEFKKQIVGGFAVPCLELAKKFHALPPNFRHKNRFGNVNKAHLGRVKVDGDW